MRGLSRAIAVATLLSFAQASRAGEQAKSALESFRAAMKDARSIEDRAVQVQALGWTDPAEPGIVAELSRFLVQSPADINSLLPVTAAAALGRMRGNRNAALVLVQVLPGFRKSPYVYRRMIAALGQVGNEPAQAALQELLTGNEGEPALQAAAAMAELPADLALDGLLKGWDSMQKRRARVGDDVKRQQDRVGVDILRFVQRISGERYPTLTEMQVWWTRRAPKWKDIAAEREREREKLRPTAPAAELPPVTLVELLFNENGGTTLVNMGSSSGSFGSAAVSKTRPTWSHEIPPPGNASSLDWGSEPGPYAVEMAGPLDHLRNLKSFTITAWIDARTCASEGPGGNRILSWLDRDGVELVHRADGSLQVGINQRAELSANRTSPQQVPGVATEAALLMNWRFIAVTYDSTATLGHVKIYVGTRDQDAGLVFQRESTAGVVGPRIAAGVTIGNLPQAQRALNPKGSFRGLLDEVRIFGSARDGSGALSPAAVVRVQERVPMPP